MDYREQRVLDGKSEVCYLPGNSLQAFGTALTRKGFFMLTPNSIGTSTNLTQIPNSFKSEFRQ